MNKHLFDTLWTHLFASGARELGWSMLSTANLEKLIYCSFELSDIFEEMLAYIQTVFCFVIEVAPNPEISTR